MERRILISGFGGQGVLLFGRVVCQAGMKEGLNVTWLPSYGPEMRGGTASCSVTLSDHEIGSPIVTQPGICIVMNQPSFERYMPAVRPGGALFVNASLVEIDGARDDIDIFLVPASQIAMEAGNGKAANMVMLGAVLKNTGLLRSESATKALVEILGENRKHLLPVNERAMALGSDRAMQRSGQ